MSFLVQNLKIIVIVLSQLIAKIKHNYITITI